MVATESASGAWSIGNVTPAPSASMLVATASASSTRRSNTPRPAVSSAAASGSPRDSQSIFAPMPPRRAKMIQWSQASTAGPMRRPTSHPITGMRAWKPPKRAATRATSRARRRFAAMPPAPATAMASIASPRARRTIARKVTRRS